ncbi:MAG: hypothetical protein WBB46_00905 [Candidatus Deferrimicrobiaceae bacterium]|jgi:hypothetical protein
MDWVAVSAIAGVFAAIFVALTAVYLAIQIKSSAQATHSHTYHLATSALAEMAAIIGKDKDLSRIFRIGMVNPEALSEDDFTQFGYLGISLFRRFENVFFQYQSGMINEDFWIGHRDNILWFFHRPGMQAWWKDRKFAFSKRFREFLDDSTESEIASPDTRRL